MKAIPISALKVLSDLTFDERVAAIPPGKAFLLADAAKEWGLTNHYAADRARQLGVLIYAELNGKSAQYVVSLSDSRKQKGR